MCMTLSHVGHFCGDRTILFPGIFKGHLLMLGLAEIGCVRACSGKADTLRLAPDGLRPDADCLVPTQGPPRSGNGKKKSPDDRIGK